MATTADPSDLGDHAKDLASMVVDYVRQEVLDPVRGLGRYLAFGLAGTALWGLGLVLVFLGVLRLLQAETGSALDGNLSFLPYLVTLSATGAAAALALAARARRKEGR